MKEVKVNELYRTYNFGNGNFVVLENIIELTVRPSGTHRIKTGDGLLHIIPTGWIHVEIIAENSEWTI